MVRIRKIATGFIALSAAALSGCGWSARDTHLARPGSIPSRSGDGSKLTSTAPADPFAAATGTTVVEGINR